MSNEITNCFKCLKPIQFENSDDTIEEYEIDQKGNKYCSKCFYDLGLEDEE